MTFTVDKAFYESVYPAIAVSLSAIVIVAFGVLAMVVSWQLTKKRNKSVGISGGIAAAEDFVTARGTSGKWTLAASFYGGAIGSWVIASTADYAYWGGVIGCVMYAVSAAFPLIIVTYLGTKIQKLHPDVLSLSDFSAKRFGPFTQGLVVLVTMINMGVAMAAEYTTVASLFTDFVGMGDFSVFMVILLGLVTLTYSTVGGLRASLITDRAQAGASVVMFVIVAIYLAATFRIPAKSKAVIDSDPELKSQLMGTTVMGYSSLFTMPLSMLAATIFSEAVWQRVWASENPRVLRQGVIIAAFGVFAVVFTIGFTGVLGLWAGLKVDNSNLRLFYVLQPLDEPVTVVRNVIGIIVMVLAVTMSESAIDSMINGIGASISGALLPRLKNDTHALLLGRIIIVVINIPLIIIGMLRLKVINLFLAANLICTCAAFPFVLGFFLKRSVPSVSCGPTCDEQSRVNISDRMANSGPTCDEESWVDMTDRMADSDPEQNECMSLCYMACVAKYLNDAVPFLSFMASLLILIGYGAADTAATEAAAGRNSVAERLSTAIVYAFYGNQYSWNYFLTAIGASVGTTVFFMTMVAGIVNLQKRCF